MSEAFHKQLVQAVSASWDERAPEILGLSSTLALLASKEVAGEAMAAAIAVAVTWSSAFVVPFMGQTGGLSIFLFKSDESEDIDGLVRQSGDGQARPGVRALVTAVMAGVPAGLSAEVNETLAFGPVSFVDLSVDESKLAKMVGDVAHIGTFSLSIGEVVNSQALVLYAPNGVLALPAVETASTQEKSADPQHSPSTGAEEASMKSASHDSAATASANASRRVGHSHADTGPRNIERLLEVELDVVVRFGITYMPLREVVRMGIGTMIELNRGVDEPVELLVNGRTLARGEVVVVDGYYGVRITEIGPPSERAASIL